MSDIEIFGISLPLFIAELGIVVTAFSAAVGIWIERDHSKPIKKAVALTVLVVFAGSLSMYQTWQNDSDQAALQADLATILEQLDTVAVKSEVELPELNDALKAELTIHGRANPKVLMNLAKAIAAKGGDPLKVLAAYLPEADLQAMKRDGKFDEALADPNVSTVDEKRPKLVFGSGIGPHMRNETSDEADAGAPDAAIAGDGAEDGGVLEDAGVDAGDAGADAESPVTAIATEKAELKRQIDEARRLIAEAKTPQEKLEAQRKLFPLLGALEKLEKTPPPAASASSPPKKPKIEIEEDDKP